MIEWVATILTLIGVVLNIKKIRVCFIIWFVANSFWIYIMAMSQHWGMVICQIVFCATCVWGWFAWAKDKKCSI